MMIKNMTEEEKKEYFTRLKENGFEVYLDDLLCGITHIAEIPFEYRTADGYTAYIYAIRAARDTPRPSYVRFTEMKVVEHLLLSDIARLRAEHREEEADCFALVYRDYFINFYADSCGF